MPNSYTTGTLSATNGSTAITGSATAWQINAVAGALLWIDGETRAYEIVSVSTNTAAVLDKPYAGATGSGKTYRMWLPDSQAASNVTINQQLATIITMLNGSAAEVQDFLDAGNLAGALSALGISGFIQTLLNDADAATARGTLGANNASNLNSGTVPDLVLPTRLKPNVLVDALSPNTLKGFGATRLSAANPDVPTSSYYSHLWYSEAGDVGGQIIVNYGTGKIFARGAYNTNTTPVYSAWAEYLSKVEQDSRYPIKPQNAVGAGQWVALNSATGGSMVLPTGGTWSWVLTIASDAGAWTDNSFAGISAGGSTIGSAFAGYRWKGFAWRISE